MSLITNGLPTPDGYFLVAGASEGYTPLNAFDGALLDAGIGDCNLVKMSSILPPNARKIEPHKQAPGSLVPVAYGSMTATLPGEEIAAAVAVGIPVNNDEPGVIMEYSARGSAENAEAIVRDMVKQAFTMRKREIKEICSISIEHKVVNNGAAFAAVVLTYL